MFTNLKASALAVLAALTIAFVGPAAHAQKAPDAAAAAPTAAAPAKAKKAASKPSICKGLVEAACGTHTECIWRAASKRKNGTAVKAHCRKKPDISKAQAAKAAKAAEKAAAAAAPATAEPATGAPAAKKASKKATPATAPAAPAKAN